VRLLRVDRFIIVIIIIIIIEIGRYSQKCGVVAAALRPGDKEAASTSGSRVAEAQQHHTLRYDKTHDEPYDHSNSLDVSLQFGLSDIDIYILVILLLILIIVQVGLCGCRAVWNIFQSQSAELAAACHQQINALKTHLFI